LTIDPSWAYNEALNNNPHLQNSPGLAADVLRSPSPLTTAPVLVHTATMSSVQQAAQDYAAENPVQNHWWDSVVHNAATSLGALNKPLKEVQRDYKYIHSLYSRHGIIWGTLGTLAVAGGATIGTLVAGPMGTVIGAELAATGLRKIGGNLDEFKNSVTDSENENYKVSAGRDFAHMLQIQNTDSGAGKLVSGGIDATFDLTMDPLMKAGNLSKVLKTGKWVKGSNKFIPLIARPAGAQAFLERNSLRMYSADQVAALYQTAKFGNIADKTFGAGRQYNRSLEELAGMTTGDVIAKYPELQGLASEIGAAKKAEDVHKVFLRTFSEQDLMTKFAVSGSPFVPSRSVARSALSSVSDKLRQPGWDKLDSSVFEYRNAANFIIPRIVKNNDNSAKFILPLAFNPFSGEKWASALAKKTRTFSGYKSYVIDQGTLDLSTKTFNPNDPGALVGIYRVMRFSLSEKSARNIAGAFSDAPDLATKRSILLAGYHEMFKAAGLPNDSHLVSDLLEQIGMHGEGTIGSGTYGHGLSLGDEASIVSTASGSSAAALYTHQAGKWAYPDFGQVKLAMRSMGHVGKLYGTVDDFTARNWTNSIFKPLALLTTGFGLRIAASEIIPAMIRFGGLDMAKAKIAGAAAKMNYKLIPGEDQHVLANVALALSGNDFDYTAGKLLTDVAGDVPGKPIRSAVARTLTKIADPEDFDLAARITLATNGHMATGATLSGHGTEAEFTERQRQLQDLTGQRIKRTMTEAPDGKYSHYTAHDDHFDIHWISNLQKASQNKVAQSIAADVRQALDSGLGQDEAWKLAQVKEEARIRGVQYDPLVSNNFGEKLKPAEDIYAMDRKTLSRYKDQAPQTFAFHRIDDLRNTLTGTDGTFHDNFLNMIANRQKPMVTDVMNLDSATKPKAVIGPELEPYIGNNVMQRIIQTGFKKVIDPIVGNLSRQPLFFQHTKQAMTLYQPMIDAGMISEETGLRLAMTRATHAMLPQIHNVALRTQFSVLVQNYLPFYFAQEQATKRYIKLATDNPEALRAYQLIEQGLNDPGFIQKDDQGNRYLMFPGVGELGAAAISGAAAIGLPVQAGLPVTVRGNMESLKTVLPEMSMPGVSPIMAVSANAIASLHPEWARQMKAIIGDMAFGRGIIDEIIPSAPLRNMVKAVIIRDGDASFQNAMLSSIASASYAKSTNPDYNFPGPDASPAEKQAFLERIKNNATSIMIIKAVLSAVSPLSPQVTQEQLGLRDEFYKLVQQKGDYPTALHEFLIKHGDGAISYTVARSEGTIKGANMPYTNEVANWLESNNSLLLSNRAVGAAFLIPQSASGGGDKQAIYDEIMKLHLRTKRNPQDFLDAIYSATGNNAYFQDKAIHDATIAAAGGNKSMVEAENANWATYKSNFALANPIWADDFQSPEKRNIAKKAIDDLQYLFSNNKVPNTEQSRLVSGLLDDYKKHQEAKDQIRGLNVKVTLTQENDNWDAYLTQLTKDEPRLTTIINGVFRRLD
jgi:hypothetical protein